MIQKTTTIFWDFDGTLVHSEHLWSQSMYDALLAVNSKTSVPFSDIRLCNRQGFTWQTPECDHTSLIGETWWDFMRIHFINSYLSCGETQAIAENAASLVRGILTAPSRYRLYTDTVSVLTASHEKGYKNIVLSNNYPELENTLNALGLLPFVDGVVVSALEGYDKPRQELFDIAKSRFPSQRAIMVGDNPIADIKGGRDAGMITVLVHNGHCDDADHCCDTLTDVLQILER